MRCELLFAFISATHGRNRPAPCDLSPWCHAVLWKDLGHPLPRLKDSFWHSLAAAEVPTKKVMQSPRSWTNLGTVTGRGWSGRVAPRIASPAICPAAKTSTPCGTKKKTEEQQQQEQSFSLVPYFHCACAKLKLLLDWKASSPYVMSLFFSLCTTSFGLRASLSWTPPAEAHRTSLEHLMAQVSWVRHTTNLNSRHVSFVMLYCRW